MAAACALRAFGREVDVPARVENVGDDTLTAALAEFVHGWAAAGTALSAQADTTARRLEQTAAEYVDVDGQLIPPDCR